MPITHRSILGDAYCIRRLHNARSHGHGDSLTTLFDHVFRPILPSDQRRLNAIVDRKARAASVCPPTVRISVRTGRDRERWSTFITVERVSARGFPPRGTHERFSLACRSDREKTFETFSHRSHALILFFSPTGIQYMCIYVCVRVCIKIFWQADLDSLLPFKFNGS